MTTAEMYVLLYPPDLQPKLEEILGHREQCRQCQAGPRCAEFRRLQQESRVILKRAREAAQDVPEHAAQRR